MSLSTIKKCTHRSCLFAPGQSWKGQGDHSCKQAGNKKKKKKNVEYLCGRINGPSDWSEIFFFNHSQALQSQKRSKPMARCSAVINSSTGFSHVLIIGSGQCVFVPSLFPTTQKTTRIQFYVIDFSEMALNSSILLHVILLFYGERLCRSGRSGVCRDTEAGGLHRPHRHVHHGQTSSIWQA